jgi:formylglycine-generating enzyme required for sulfatase activity
MNNCGPGGSGSESCCTSLEVTNDAVDGGISYYRTYVNDGGSPTGEADPATVSGFRLDKYLVTVGRFRQFVNAVYGGVGWSPTEGSGKHTHLNGGNGLVNSATELSDGGVVSYETGWSTFWNETTDIDPTDTNLESCPPGGTWTDPAGSQENLPINCVNWYEAYAFCIWDGGFLPSEAEWEYAAAGGSQQREYPWGSTAPGTNNQYAIYGGGTAGSECYYPSGTLADCDPPGVANIAPVGYASSGAGYWGQLDLAGEVQEWNLDWYATYVDPCTDCAYLPTTASSRVIRGGAFYADAMYLLPPYRYNVTPIPPTTRYSSIGFRCARTP